MQNCTRVEEVIITSLECRGKGTPEDPSRRILQIYTKAGDLLAESDPFESERHKMMFKNMTDAEWAKASAQAALKASGTELVNLRQTIEWLLGRSQDKLRQPPGNRDPYWWRDELRRRVMPANYDTLPEESNETKKKDKR